MGGGISCGSGIPPVVIQLAQELVQESQDGTVLEISHRKFGNPLVVKRTDEGELVIKGGTFLSRFVARRRYSK